MKKRPCCYWKVMLAIVLSRRPVREFDEIITLYTYEKGKVEVLAKSSKKLTSKQSAHFEPGGVIECALIPGREIHHIAKTQSVNYFPGFREHWEKSRAVAYALSLVQKITPEMSSDSSFFWFLRHWLEEIEKTTTSSVRLLDALVLGLLVCLGFKPELSNCVVCGREQRDIYKEALLNPVAKPGLYYAGGGLICPADRKVKHAVGEQTVDLGLAELSGLLALLSEDWKIASKFNLTETEEKSLHQLVYEFLRYQVELPLRDWGKS